MYPSSVVQTGVKSFGCENRIAQPSPIHSWKLMVPCVVSAVKFGASSLIRSIRHLFYQPRHRQFFTQICNSLYYARRPSMKLGENLYSIARTAQVSALLLAASISFAQAPPPSDANAPAATPSAANSRILGVIPNYQT